MKTTRKLVIGLTVFLSFSLFTLNCFATDVPISKSDTPVVPGQSRAPFRIPVTVSYSAEELNFNFIYSVGVATITVTDESGAIVYQQSTDTSAQSNLTIPIDMWDSGNYVITIQYGSINLNGQFSL
jgi:hypothetical protein